MSWFKKLKDGLSKSSKKVSESLANLPSLSALIGKSKLDAASLEEVEDALIAADLGTASAIRLANALKAYKFDSPVDAAVPLPPFPVAIWYFFMIVFDFFTTNSLSFLLMIILYSSTALIENDINTMTIASNIEIDFCDMIYNELC